MTTASRGQADRITGEAAQPAALETEADYEAAKVEIERLWGAPAGSPDGQRLAALIDAVVDYEDREIAVDDDDDDDA